MRKKRILFVTLSLGGGGAERVVSILSSELARRGQDVRLLLFERSPKEYTLNEEVEVYEFGWPQGWCKLHRIYKRIRRMREMIREIAPDIIIPFLALPTVYTYLASLGLRELTFISTVRNNPSLYPASPLMRRLVNRITKKSDRIMLQTGEQRGYFSERLNSKIFVVPNPVKQEMLDTIYHYKPEVRKIVSMGRLTKQKNHPLLIRAFAKISATVEELRLVIYGEGEERKNLEELVKELGLSEKVSLPGKTSQVSEKLAEADIFVLSSDYEGLPNTLIEAMAVGLPCISTACPTGPKDLIHNGQDGLLTKVGDEEELYTAMKMLAGSFEDRRRMGMEAKRKIREALSVDRVVDMFEEQVLR